VLGAGLTGVLLALGVVYTPTFARLMRVRCSRSRRATTSTRRGRWRLRLAGRGSTRGANAINPIIVQASLSVAFAILAEASLSFLGSASSPHRPRGAA